MDQLTMQFTILHALVTRGGREKTLFGDYTRYAYEAFRRSLSGSGFPEIWYELPLAGEPWFDLHVLTPPLGWEPNEKFVPEQTGGYPDVFAWFAKQGGEARQLALSWDISTGTVCNPAIQLLSGTYDPGLTCDFLEATGREDVVLPYRSFVERLPEGWFACYAGVFPQRPERHLRVECIPLGSLQQDYARDGGLLEEHLRQVGFTCIGDTLIERCQQLADTPFQIEFQFDIMPEGALGSTIGVSLRFACPPGDESYRPFEEHGAAGTLMQQLEAWGLVDDRWHTMSQTAFAKRVSYKGESRIVFCYPAFVKLRWRDGEPLDAKAYLMAGELWDRSSVAMPVHKDAGTSA